MSSNCMRTQFLFQRHNFSVTDLLLKSLEQKVVTFFLWRFNKNRIREQLDDMRTPVIEIEPKFGLFRKSTTQK